MGEGRQGETCSPHSGNQSPSDACHLLSVGLSSASVAPLQFSHGGSPSLRDLGVPNFGDPSSVEASSSKATRQGFITKKKVNSACHFCDHAARRKGRETIALQIACSSGDCSKVFCSRPLCVKKLPAELGIKHYDDFVRFKCLLESGATTFICPHCTDALNCPGAQCFKRWQRKRGVEKTSGSNGEKRSSKRRQSSSSSTNFQSSESPINATVIAETVNLSPFENSINFGHQIWSMPRPNAMPPNSMASAYQFPSSHSDRDLDTISAWWLSQDRPSYFRAPEPFDHYLHNSMSSDPLPDFFRRHG